MPAILRFAIVAALTIVNAAPPTAKDAPHPNALPAVAGRGSKGGAARGPLPLPLRGRGSG